MCHLRWPWKAVTTVTGNDWNNSKTSWWFSFVSISLKQFEHSSAKANSISRPRSSIQRRLIFSVVVTQSIVSHLWIVDATRLTFPLPLQYAVMAILILRLFAWKTFSRTSQAITKCVSKNDSIHFGLCTHWHSVVDGPGRTALRLCTDWQRVTCQSIRIGENEDDATTFVLFVYNTCLNY